MGVISSGEYGISSGIVYSLPVTIKVVVSFSEQTPISSI